MEDEPFALAQLAARELAHALGRRHDVAVVLGSGWGSVAGALGDPVAELSMLELAGFPAPAVAGHAGTVTSVSVGGHAVLVLAGRAHLYEGHTPAAVVHGVRSAVLNGAAVVVLTNAAGSLRAELPVGAPVLIADHLNLTGSSPLVGAAPPPPHPMRFVDMTDAYSARLRAVARRVEPTLPEGVYAALLGGAYETPAEIRMLLALGADLVGMSTALETTAAVHLGAEVLGLSLVTNLAAGLSSAPLDHFEVVAAGGAATAGLGRLVRSIVEAL